MKSNLLIKHRVKPIVFYPDCQHHLFYIGISPDEKNEKLIQQNIQKVMNAHHNAFISGTLCDPKGESHKSSEIHLLWVNPRFRNQKYGTRLLKTLIAENDKLCAPIRIKANPIEYENPNSVYYGGDVKIKDISTSDYQKNLQHLISFYQEYGFHIQEEVDINKLHGFAIMQRDAVC